MTDTMQALWLVDRTLSLARRPLPAPAPDEASLRVHLAGICNTDLEMVKGYYPYTGIPGHEFVGTVEEAPGAPSWVGRRVVGEINVVCGRCPACGAGRRTHCENRVVLGIRGRDGTFAERVLVPIANLHSVPDAVSDEAAVFTEPLAAALEIQEQVRVGSGDRVVVVGDGKLGNLVAQTLALTGCDLLVLGRHAPKLALLHKRGIATATEDPPPSRADIVVECTGSPAGFERARRAVRPRGSLVLKSTYAGTTTVNLSSLVVDEITLVGSRCGPFEHALALLEQGAVDVLSLIHARYPLAEGLAAFAHAARPGVLKVLLAP